MTRTKAFISIGCIGRLAVACFLSSSAMASVDAWLADGGLRVSRGEFTICSPLDTEPTPGEWVYIIRYHESFSGPTPFGIAMTRSNQSDVFILAIYEQKRIDDMNRIPADKREAAATKTRTVDKAFANAIYGAWIRALQTAKFAGLPPRTGGDHVYIAAFDQDAGFIAAETDDFRSDLPSGRLMAIAGLIRRFVSEKNEKVAEELRSRIIAAADAFEPAKTHH